MKPAQAMSPRSRSTAANRTGRRVRGTGVLAVLGAVVSLAASPAAQAAATPVTVTFTGNTFQSFRVPARVTSLEIVASGANGGVGFSGGATGGAAGSGSQITGTFLVTPGAQIGMSPGAGGGSATKPGFDCFLGTQDGFSQGGGGGSTELGEAGVGGSGGRGDLCAGGGGGGGGAATVVQLPGAGELIAGGGGGGGGSGGIAGYSGGSGGSGGPAGGGGNGTGPGSGNGGGGGAAPNANGTTAGDACEGCSSGGGGGGGSGAPGGTAGGAGGGGAGGGGGGGAGGDQIPGALHDVTVGTAPSGGGHDGVVTITYTPPDTTETAVVCNPVNALAGQRTDCTVTVTDTEPSPTITPTGSIIFSTNGLGDFSANGCMLQGSGASAHCSFSYTPTALGTGTQTLGAAYSGDDSHNPSSGSVQLGVGLRSAATAVKCLPVYVPLEKPATCTATVTDSTTIGTAITPGGRVSFTLDPLTSNMKGTFSDGGQCTLDGTGASATCSVSYTPTAVGGLDEITGVYSGDKAHRGGSAFSGGYLFVIATAAVGSPAGQCAGRPVTTPGSARADHLAGTSKREVIAAGPGDDRISAGGGSDLVCAGAGDDRVRRGSGNDRLLGQAGDDILSGGAGRDVLNGGQGDDRIFGGPGRDRIFGGPGKDRITPGGPRPRRCRRPRRSRLQPRRAARRDRLRPRPRRRDRRRRRPHPPLRDRHPRPAAASVTGRGSRPSPGRSHRGGRPAAASASRGSA